MQLFLVTTLTAAILVVLPIVGSGMREMHNIAAPARMTIVEKNQSSPTLEELGQKAGDPAQADAAQHQTESLRRPTRRWSRRRELSRPFSGVAGDEVLGIGGAGELLVHETR